MKRKLAMMLLMTVVTLTAWAQSAINGTVVSASDGEPIIGATVRVKGASQGAVTDVNGKFSINVQAGKTLVFSYIGMQSKEAAAKNGMTITLGEDDTMLDEVMVVAFGTQKKSAFTGSAAVVDSKELSKHTVTNVADALVGSVPGLQIRGGSGAPGASQGSINIRGIASMYASTDPLVVVDGAPYSASLSNIPQDDIESITVLKDAASAALYGARGAAGVILITTKKGKTKDAQINVDMRWGAGSRAIQDYETITDPGLFMETYYSQFYNYAFNKLGLSNAGANQWVNDRMITDQNIGLQYNPYTLPEGQSLIGLDGKLNPNATLGRAYTHNGETYYILPDNWTDAAYHTAFRQEYTANMSGGTSNASYYGSLGYLNEDGIIDNSGYERIAARFKADYQARKWLRMGANVGYVHSNQESNPNLSDSSLGSTNIMYYTSNIAPIYPLFVRTLDANGNPVIRKDMYGNDQYDYGVPASNFPGIGTRLFLATGNPIGSNKYNKVETERHQFNGTFTFDVDITDYLKFNSTNTLNLDLQSFSDYENPFYGPTASENGRLTKYTTSALRQTYVQTLQFHKGFGLNDVTFMLGHEWYKIRTKYLDAVARGGFSPDIKEINAFADRYDSHSYQSNYNVEGFFANALYNYDEKYYGSVSYRRDATSNFSKDNRWGDFWSVGGAWILSSEEFFKNLNASWVNQLKIKASIGQQGNDGIGAFRYKEMYTLSKGDGTMLPSFSAVGNNDITWETTTNFNVGVEFALFNRRLSGSIDFYNKNTTDQLFWLSIPESFGTRGYYGNLGDIRNTGLEFVLSADVIRTKDIVWNITGNIAHNKTKVTKLPDTKVMDRGGFMESSNSVYCWYEVGKPLYNVAIPEYAGVNENGEALYWVDENILNDPNVSNTSKPGKEHSYTTTNWSDASYYEQGSIMPKVSGGFSTSVSFYGFDVNATFDYQIGGKIYDYRYADLMTPVNSKGNGYTYHMDVTKSWSANNTDSNIPRFQYADSYTTGKSTRFLTNASYLNFQSFSVGYTIPRNVLKSVGISKLRVYAQGENLCFWSARKGLDPRYSYISTATGGVNTYSPVRTIMGGVQVSF